MRKEVMVSEIVTIDEINSWDKGDIVTIKAGTGRGKSYFIKNVLYALAKRENKKILMLIHRRNCVDQFMNEIIGDKKTDIIDIKTYQSLETLYGKHKKTFNFSEYEYIVCDEFHYFMGDAAFNITTDISLNTILAQKNKIRIFMSATGDYMKAYINRVKKLPTIDYELPITYDFISNLTFFHKDETLEEFIDEAIEKNNKAIFFIQSATKAYNLYKKYKDYCLFNCGKSDKHYKYVNKDKIDNMLKEEKFEELILITTTCMDAGVNIIDTNLKHIVCDVKDTGVLIQCIGRKRIQSNDDKFNLYIKTINNKQLGGMETQINKRIKKADYHREHTNKEYIEKYGRDPDRAIIVHDKTVEEDDKGTKEVNELMYFKSRIDLTEIGIMKNYGKFGYCKHIANMFGFIDKNGMYKYRTIKEDGEREQLNNYLDNIKGQKIYLEKQKELINRIDLRVNGRQQRSYSKLNEGLKMLKLPYVIIPKKSNNERYWILEKIDI